MPIQKSGSALRTPSRTTQLTSPIIDENRSYHASPFSWDMQLSSMPYFPCFQFISAKLAQSKLYVMLILLAHEPFCIPTWPISRATRFKVIRIFRKACERFRFVPVWVALIAYGSTDRVVSALLEMRPSDSYLIRRSIIQHETIFSGEGLTLFTVDHIYTFKNSLTAFANIRSQDTGHEDLIVSTTQLLHRINTIYRGVRLSKSYLERAFGTELRHSVLREVHEAYLRIFGEPGIQGMAGNQIPQLAELESPIAQTPISPVLELDTRTIAAQIGPFVQEMDGGSSDVLNTDRWSICSNLGVGTVTYPEVPARTKPPGLPLSMTTPMSSDEITTTICSRCLVNMDMENIFNNQEMTMCLGPEWETFRRVGLGILRY